MKWNTSRAATAAAPLSIISLATQDAARAETRGERGRRAILAGWLITMLGIVAYIVAMSRAGEHASILDAFSNTGLLGWFSAALLATGVIVWFLGNIDCLDALAEIPASDDDE